MLIQHSDSPHLRLKQPGDSIDVGDRLALFLQGVERFVPDILWRRLPPLPLPEHLMVIVIPFEATQRLRQMAQTHRVNLPVPLSSPCAGYLSPDEMDTILQTLVPLSATDAATTRLVSDLQDYREQRLPVMPCAT